MTITYTDYVHGDLTDMIAGFFAALDCLHITPSDLFLVEDDDILAWLQSADPISYMREQTEKIK